MISTASIILISLLLQGCGEEETVQEAAEEEVEQVENFNSKERNSRGTQRNMR